MPIVLKNYFWQNLRKCIFVVVQVQKNKRNVKSKRSTKSESISKNEEDRSFHRQSSSSCCSEDDSNASQELNVGSTSSVSPKDSASLKSNGKSMSSKGPATDPQSVYARVCSLKMGFLSTISFPNETKELRGFPFALCREEEKE